jgi:hypothetical protein
MRFTDTSRGSGTLGSPRLGGGGAAWILRDNSQGRE